MDDMEQKLGAVLNNPQLMQQIMGMAQTLSQSQNDQNTQSNPPPHNEPNPPLPNIDFSLLQKLSGLSRQGCIDKEQQALLNALCPYLARDRIHKLERAMRAAKMAKMASEFLNAGGLQILTGR